MTKYESFNQSGFSKFLNSMPGRILRISRRHRIPCSRLYLSGTYARCDIYGVGCSPIERRGI